MIEINGKRERHVNSVDPKRLDPKENMQIFFIFLKGAFNSEIRQ